MLSNGYELIGMSNCVVNRFRSIPIVGHLFMLNKFFLINTRKMVNFKLSSEFRKMKFSSCHQCESQMGIQPVTS